MEKILIIITVAFSLGGCTKLDTDTKSSVASDLVFTQYSNYQASMAEQYFNFVSPNGGAMEFEGDIWLLEEIPADLVLYSQDNFAAMNTFLWNSSYQPIIDGWNRFLLNIAQANEFIRQANPATVAKQGFTESQNTSIALYLQEARYIRALNYFYLLDNYRNIPLYTDADPVGSAPKAQVSPQEAFNYIESELKDLETKVLKPSQAAYGEVSLGAVYALEAKLYMNSQVYTGVPKWTEAITACNNLFALNAYSLAPHYRDNFSADNNTSPELIFSFYHDGHNVQVWNGLSLIMRFETVNGPTINLQDTLAIAAHFGERAKSTLVNLYPDNYSVDSRALFDTLYDYYGTIVHATKDIPSINYGAQGYLTIKYTNRNKDGSYPAPDWQNTIDFPYTDFPLFRLADFYLLYAEAVLRGGSGGDMNTALGYVNKVRERAYDGTNGDIAAGDLTLNWLLDERGRELYNECFRRSDLIRFGKFSSGIWPWKGNVAAGVATDPHFEIYPIPGTELLANPNAKQNPGYDN